MVPRVRETSDTLPSLLPDVPLQPSAVVQPTLPPGAAQQVVPPPLCAAQRPGVPALPDAVGQPSLSANAWSVIEVSIETRASISGQICGKC